MDCKKGGLIATFHKELCGRVSDLAGKAFNLSYVRNNTLIHQGHAVLERKA